MSRSLCRTRLSGPVVDSTSVAEYSRAFSGVLKSACFSLESVDSAAEGGIDITTVERANTRGKGWSIAWDSKGSLYPPSSRVRRREELGNGKGSDKVVGLLHTPSSKSGQP